MVPSCTDEDKDQKLGYRIITRRKKRTTPLPSTSDKHLSKPSLLVRLQINRGMTEPQHAPTMSSNESPTWPESVPAASMETLINPDNSPTHNSTPPSTRLKRVPNSVGFHLFRHVRHNTPQHDRPHSLRPAAELSSRSEERQQ